MRITNSKDGVPRFTLKIETRIDAYNMAVHLISALRIEEGMSSTVGFDETLAERDARLENRIKDLISGLSHAEIIEKVRDSILSNGTEIPHYRVADEGYSTAVDFLSGYLKRKYKGFNK